MAKAIEEKATDKPVEEKTETKSVAKEARTVKDTDIVTVKSLVCNVHYTCPKTNDYFVWHDEGEEQEMTVAQLKVMKNQHNGYFSKKFLYPKDETVLKKLNLQDYFKVKFGRGDMKLLYGDDIEVAKEKVMTIPDDEKDTFIVKVKKAVKDGKIANVKIIRMLERELGIDLMVLV